MGFLSSLFGVKDRTPATSTNVVSQKLPAEIAPAVTRAVDEATAIFEAEKARGYDPYTGETIAPLTAEEQQAMAGIAGLVGTATPLVQESLETYRTGAEKFTPETAQEYMSPYQRAVTDIEKREAGRQFDIAQQARDAQAAGAGAGSLMGTRSAILEAEAARNQQQLLSDIEARGLQSAFTNAQQQFAAQKARERQMAGDVAQTGTGLFQAGLAEQGALQTVGEQKRELGQSALDEAYARFLEERNFPQQTLADFTQTIYGNPLATMPTKTTQESKLPGAGSIGQQLLGLGAAGLNIYGRGTQGFTQPFGLKPFFTKEGGSLIEAQAGTPGGLPSLVDLDKAKEFQPSKLNFNPLKERKSIIEKIRLEKDPDKKRQLQRSLAYLATDPTKKINDAGVISKTEKVTTEDKLKAQQQQAKEKAKATLTGLGLEGKSIDDLGLALGKTRDSIGGRGIVGIDEAGQKGSFIESLTTMLGKTATGARESAKEKAALEREDLRSQQAKRQELLKRETETKVGEKVETFDAKIEALDENKKRLIKEVESRLNLKNEINAWPSKYQEKLANLVKEGLTLDKLKKEIKKLDSEVELNKAKAKAEGKDDTTIKPAVYGQIRNNFEALLKTGVVGGTPDGVGGFIINKINGRAIKPEESKRIAKVLADAAEKIDKGRSIGEVTTFMSDEIYGIARGKQKKPKSQTLKTGDDVTISGKVRKLKVGLTIQGKNGIKLTWDGNNFVDPNGNIVNVK